MISGGTPPFTYTWSYLSLTARAPCDLTNYINSPKIPTSCESSSCKLKLTVTDFCGNMIEANTPDYKNLVSGIENIEMYPVDLIPNPTTGSFTVSNIQEATVYVYSALSSHIKTFEHVSHNEIMNISHLPAGIYFLKIVEPDRITNKKIVLSK